MRRVAWGWPTSEKKQRPRISTRKEKNVILPKVPTIARSFLFTEDKNFRTELQDVRGSRGQLSAFLGMRSQSSLRVFVLRALNFVIL